MMAKPKHHSKKHVNLPTQTEEKTSLQLRDEAHDVPTLKKRPTLREL
jgi:hypothetical protein